MSDEIRAIVMPKWGMEMTQGEINLWHAEIGAEINAGDDLVDVETSKIVNTVTASDTGVLRAIIALPGETHLVGALLGVVAQQTTKDGDINAFISSQAGTPKVVTPPTELKAVAPPTVVDETPLKSSAKTGDRSAEDLGELESGTDDSATSASPVARRLAAEYGVNLNKIRGSGRHGRVSKRDLETAVIAAGGSLPSTHGLPSSSRIRDDSHVSATPVARRLAKQLGISLLECRVSGARNRVCKADVDAVKALKSPAAPQIDTTQASDGALRTTKITGIRQTIAARLQSSKQSKPHFRIVIDAEVDELMAVRTQINNDNPDAKISVNDCIIKACASALIKVPALNVQFDGEEVNHFDNADISIAVAISGGLITPIVAQANHKGLIAISNETRDLATRAKLNRLKPEEFQGGSFCISNLGMFGIKQFDAIINPPQGAILAVGAAEQRAVVKAGQIKAATVITLTLSSDHRIIDGATGAQFMSTLKNFLEQPANMLG